MWKPPLSWHLELPRDLEEVRTERCLGEEQPRDLVEFRPERCLDMMLSWRPKANHAGLLDQWILHTKTQMRGAPVSRGIQYSATQSRFEPCSEIALSRCVHRRNLEPLVKAPRQPSICNSLLSHIEIMGRIEIMRSKRDHEIEVSPSVIASDSCLLEIRPMWPHERIGKPYKLIG